MTTNGFSRERLEKLRQFDTCTLSNAVERTRVRLRNEGFVHGGVQCRFPALPPVVGYAVTGRIRTSAAPVNGRCYHENIEFWRYVESIPAPRFIVLKDFDHAVGMGALFGEIHARICRALDCVAYLTNGSVRDLPEIERLGFQLFSACVSVSHAYAHVVDFGHALDIGGLRISPGDLLHGDMHGVLSIPLGIADELPRIAEQIRSEERELFRLCDREDFSVDMLAARLNEVRTEVRD